MGKAKNSGPVLLDGMASTSLDRIAFNETPKNESWLQDLLFKHPELIPFDQLDPLFRNSVPVAREVESGVGPVDILYVNADGLITIVETKLWRNPEARRVAVAQIINYAARLANTPVDELSEAVDQANAGIRGTLTNAAKGSSEDFDERRFHDGLSQNLKRGRLLLLIIGDGIREDVEEMAEFLGRRADLGFTLRLVEMEIYRWGDVGERYFVQPRVIAQTREVVRAIVSNNGGAVVVNLPAEISGSHKPARVKLNEEAFYAELAEVGSPMEVDFVRWMVNNAADHNLKVQWMQGGPVFKHFLDDGTFFTLFQLYKGAWLTESNRFARRCVDLGLDDSIWKDYFNAIIQIVPNAKLTHFKSGSGNEWDEIEFAENSSPLEAIANNKDSFLASVDTAVSRIRAARVG